MNLDCQHVREVMDSYLSEELSVETNHSVLSHVAECRACAEELKRRRRLRALLSESLDVAVDADRVRARIAHAADREQGSWKRVARLGGVAATLVAAVAVARAPCHASGDSPLSSTTSSAWGRWRTYSSATPSRCRLSASSREPTRTHMPSATDLTDGTRSVTTRMPESRWVRVCSCANASWC